MSVLKFINWKAVSEIPDSDGYWYLKMAFCHIKADSAAGQNLRQAFPQYFTEKEDDILPISWLRLVHEGRQDISPENNRFPDELSTRGILKKYGIPVVLFSGTEANQEQWNFPLLPKKIARQCRFGKVIEFEGALYVVTQCERIEGEELPSEISLSPRQCFEMKGD